MDRQPKLCILHVGKTGGSYLRSILRHNRANWSRPLQLLRHSATMANTLENFGETRQVAFTFRNPTDRFVSAFYSRQRQGRPTYQFQWSPAEAIAYLWFETAEELALALTSSDERQRSAALFAFDAIEHLRSDMAIYFGNAELLQLSKPSIVACVDVAHLTECLPAFLRRIGVETFTMPKHPKFHAAPNPLPALSADAENALRQHWAAEYEIYEAAQRIAAEQGLSG
ncbi:MAG: hypothetical protein AAGA08_07450 [Pseudomonadota bacterium]